MTTSFTASTGFYKELEIINQGIQNVATAHNLFTLECEFHRLSGYLSGLQQVLYTDVINLYALYDELIEVKRERYKEIMQMNKDIDKIWFGDCNAKLEDM